MVPEHLFTIESEERLYSSVYRTPGGDLSIWVKIGVAALDVGSPADAEDLIDLLRETIKQAYQEQ